MDFEFVDHYGLPLVILAGFLLMARGFLRWVKPWADRILQSLVDFIATSKESNELNSKTLKANHELLTRNTVSLEALERAIEKLAELKAQESELLTERLELAKRLDRLESREEHGPSD